MLARARRAVSDQLSRPSGRLGRIVAVLMNRGNRGLNDEALELLDVAAGTRVLDLGFGGGLTFAPLLARGAVVYGVDRAPEMVTAAQARHAEAVRAGRLILQTGDVEALPLADGTVDRVVTVNTVYFWPDLAPSLRELHRVLTPGGRVVIGIRDGSVMRQVSPDVFTLRPPEDLSRALSDAGFTDVAVRTNDAGTTHLIAAVRAPASGSL